MKKFLCELLALLCVFQFATVAAAADAPSNEVSDATVERVMEEILTGEITNDADVLKVALAQYQDRAAAVAYSMDENKFSSTAENASPTIMQIVGTDVDEDGEAVELVAATGLLAVDESGESVYTDRLYRTEYGALDKYQIVATHTVYFYHRMSDEMATIEHYVKIQRMVTTLQYNGSYRATRLEHVYTAYTWDYPQSTWNNPEQRTTYTDYPSEADWEYSFGDFKPGFGTSAYIYYGQEYVRVRMDVCCANGDADVYFTGTW